MKKLLSLCLAAALALTLTACGSDAAAKKVGGNNAPTVQDILDAGASSSQDEWVEYDSSRGSQGVTEGAPTPDPEVHAVTGNTIDLTAMSSTMVYSEVYNMMSMPEEYLGKTVIMEGNFDVYEGDGRNYYACIIADATACCSQGIEFELTGARTYPEDYPERYSTIKVRGTFETYEENGLLYCQLGDAQLIA